MMVDLRRIATIHVTLVLLATGAIAVSGVGDATSVLFGGAVMGGNVWVLWLMARAMGAGVVDPSKRGRATLAALGFILKTGLFIGGIALVFWRLPIEMISFVVGVTCFLIACVFEAMWVGLSGAKGVQ